MTDLESPEPHEALHPRKGIPEQTDAAPALHPHRLKTTDTLICAVVLAAVLSYVIPAFIVLGPFIAKGTARSYIHVWRVALHKEPACPVTTWKAATECLLPPDSYDNSIPIP